jgi:threonine dehydrogenase-like Zn-dependent dehydrogenase
MRILRPHGKGVIKIEEVPDPGPGPGEVVVKTAVSAICGSELHSYRGDGEPTGNGGHEAAGTVSALGQGVSTLKIGQRVGVSAVAGCGKCGYCAKGQYTWCKSRRGYGSMHAERFLAAANACHPLPDDIPWDVGVLITGDGLGVPYHTSTKITSPETQTIAVFGAGPIGLGNILMQKYLGRRVIAVDVSPFRLDLARKLGASVALSPKKTDVVVKIHELTDGNGADVCIEAAGRPETALNCFAAVRTAGLVIFNGEQGALPISPSEHFIRRDITAKGAWFYHFSEFKEMLALVRKGLDAGSLISDRYPLEDAACAFARFAAGETAKVVLCYQ